MIHYHGTPLSGSLEVSRALAGRHACVSFETPHPLPMVAQYCQSFILDNGAYSAWTRGKELDFDGYAEWVSEWMHHPAFDWALIPDAIDGDEDENLRLLGRWQQAVGLGPSFVPVWHLHESLETLEYFCSANFRVALGSSGRYSQVGTETWWKRMNEAMEVVCVNGRPKCRLHGLRMLDPAVFKHLPLASADSTNVARNIGIDQAWTGSYQPLTKETRALVIMERIEANTSASLWRRTGKGSQLDLELIG